jgi:hypothetical protein
MWYWMSITIALSQLSHWQDNILFYFFEKINLLFKFEIIIISMIY